MATHHHPCARTRGQGRDLPSGRAPIAIAWALDHRELETTRGLARRAAAERLTGESDEVGRFWASTVREPSRSPTERLGEATGMPSRALARRDAGRRPRPPGRPRGAFVLPASNVECVGAPRHRIE